ncbi:MAG: hypothetical protein BMS9Abin05_0690 [Rhodothermia bacterium]|nr:MAG: hypothetical protein BMS9Abin05_0690 [Rhodothermia bacterium]
MKGLKQFSAWLSVAAILLLASCSGSGSTTGDANGATDGSPNLSDYEIFDVTPYEDEPAPVDVRVVHEVPVELMQNRADAGVVQVVPGYRVQVYSSLDRDDAVQVEEDLESWWNHVSEEEKEENQLPTELAIYNKFKQPLYRIRAGDFTQRANAERLMAFMAGKFRTVFVVPDRVTIRR